MFSRRVATFLLGIWIGGCLLVDVLALEGHRIAGRILLSPSPEAQAILKVTGDAPASALLHHLASEQTRANLGNWEIAQIVLVIAMAVPLIVTDQRKWGAVAMVGAMGLLTLIQMYGISPSLNSLGRQADFQGEAAPASLQTQIWTMTRMYGLVETLKLLIGGALASYFFAMESVVRRSKSRRTRADDEVFSASAAK